MNKQTPKTIEDLRALVRPMLLASQARVRAYAFERTPNVPRQDVECLVNAIGLISEDEAIFALDHVDAEAHR